MTPDDLPIVGSAGIDGVYVHGGHRSIGMKSAPGTSRMLADMMEGRPVDAADQFAMTRFGTLDAEMAACWRPSRFRSFLVATRRDFS